MLRRANIHSRRRFTLAQLNLPTAMLHRYPALIFLLLSPALSNAAGFQLNLQGLRQLAMGNCGVAAPWDNAVIFYNPGALARIDSGMIYGSLLGVFPSTRLVQRGTGAVTDAERQVFTPFNLYASTPVRRTKGLSLGICMYMPFGTGLRWGNGWTGRYVTQEIGLQTLFVQPTASYRLSQMFSVGAGLVYAAGNFHLNSAIPVQNATGEDGQARLEGNASGVGFNAGIHAQLAPKFSAGLSYRSGVKMQVKSGDANFSVAAGAAANFPNTSFKATLPLPKVISLGIAASLTPKLDLTAEANFTGWATYDTLRFDYGTETSALQDTRAPRRYRNAMAGRNGLRYAATKALHLMIGGAYDASPVRDGYVSPDLPDASRIVATGGLSYRATKRLDVLAAVEFVNSKKRDGWYDAEQFGGMYQIKAFTAGVGVSYRF